MSKQYGLIIPKKTKDHPILPVTKSHSIFNEDSDSDTPDVAKPTGIHAIKKQDKINQKKAVEEDPTVYQYDEIYDEMEEQKKESKLAKKDQEKKPKYINRLLAAAEKRKRENERRIERKVQKEREEEGDMYKDKESFITSAYKKKLEEMRKLEEEEKREEYLESIGDVRKQGNLDGFYRHLYDQKLNYEDSKESDVKKEIKEETFSDPEDKTSNLHSGDPDSATSTLLSSEVKKEETFSNPETNNEDNQQKKRKLSNDDKKRHKKKARNYRTRKDSDEESDEIKEIKMEHLPSNIDADSDFSIDSSDSEEESVRNVDKDKESMNVQKPETTENNNALEETKQEKINDDLKNEVPQKEEHAEIRKRKIDIWKKRTVGEKFDEAVKRYFERKSQREMGL